MIDQETLHFTLAVVAVIIAFDVWTLLKRGYKSTISWNLFVISQTQPIVPCAIGVVIGHLFWPNHGACK